MSPARSDLWSYFIKDKNGGTCKLCSCLVKSAGTTTNLKRHLERRHPHSTVTNKKKPVSTTGTADVSEPGPSTSKDVPEKKCKVDDSKEENPPTSALPNAELKTSVVPSASQPRIDHMLLDMESFKGMGKKADQITNSIIYMISKDDLPLNTTEKEGFQHFLATTVPLYKAPNRKTIASLVDRKYEVLSLIVKERLSHVSNITLTTDVWTETLNTRSFLGLTCHLQNNKHLNSITLGVTELTDRHTAKNLEEHFKNILSEWNIAVENVTAVVTDNGANIVKACTNIFGTNRHLPCFAHTLDLVATKITEDIEKVKSVITAVKSIVTFSKQSVVVADDLRKAQPEGNILKLHQSVPTRWNSTYFMLERFVKLNEYLLPILINHPKSPPLVSAADMELIKEVLKILAPIEEVSREICGEKYLTASKIIPVINCLKQTLQGHAPTSETGRNFKETVLRELEKRFGSIESVTMLGIATIMDPRFKRLHFQQPLACSKIINIINKHYQDVNKQTVEEPQTSTFEQNSIQDKKTGLWEYHESLAKKSRVDHEEVGGLNIDFKLYLNQPTTDLKSDPLEYWNSGVQNTVFRDLANKYLSIVGTSVPSERLFSKAGNLMSPSRNRLGPKRLKELLFLKSLEKQDWNL